MKINKLYEKKITQEIEELLKSTKGIKLDEVIVNEDNVFSNRYCVFSRFSVLNSDKQWEAVLGEWKHNYDFPKEKPEDVVIEIMTNFINRYFEYGQVSSGLYYIPKEPHKNITNEIRSFETNKILQNRFVNSIVDKAINVQPSVKNLANKITSYRLERILHKDFITLINNVNKKFNVEVFMDRFGCIEFKNCIPNEKKDTQTNKGDER